MSGAWGAHVDPLVPEESRWHSSRHGAVATPDAIGDALVATLREAAAQEADNDFSASVVAFCGRQLARQLVEYERESRLLAKLADTGRVVTALLQATRTAAEVLPDHQLRGDAEEKEEEGEESERVSRLTLWRRTLAEERARRMEEIYEPLLSDGAKLMQAEGDETQQLEILALMKNDVEIYGAVLTERETDVIVETYTRIVRRSGVVVGTIPRWFATTASLWPDAVKTVVTEIGEEGFIRQVSIWNTLRHPNVLRLYGACHVGEAFVIQEAHTRTAILADHLSWRDVLGLAAGIGYIHERGFAYQVLSKDTFVRLGSEGKFAVGGMGLMRSGGDEQDGELDRAANVKAFGLAILHMLRRGRGDGRDLAGEVLPALKPGYLTDPEWELISSMCSADSADRPSMAEVVWEIKNLITLEERDSLGVEEEVATMSMREKGAARVNEAISEMLELTEQLCDEDAENASLYRPVSDRVVNIFQQLNDNCTSVPLFLINELEAFLYQFNRYLESELSDFASVESLDLAPDGVYRFHHHLDLLMHEAPDIIHTSRLHQWRHLLRQETAEEIAAAGEFMNVREFEGDVVDTPDATDDGSDVLGSQFLEALREKERYTKNAVALNFLRRDVEKKLGTYNSEPRLLMRWAHTGYIIRVILRAIESAVGILELTSAKLEWLEAFQGERNQRKLIYEELLSGEGRLTLEMGDDCQTRELYTVLQYARDKYASTLDAGEREITMSLFMKLEQKLKGEIISLPSWFAVSESQWSFAERCELSGDEASCVKQIEICQQLNHPNVCKFYGAYHVGRTPFAILDETAAFNTKLSFEVKDVWRLLLDYAKGLQYILSRGLAYTSLSLADFRVTWDGKRVLSCIGLTRHVIDDPDGSQFAASNVLAFGLIGFQILAFKHLEAARNSSEDDSPSLQDSQELSNEWLRAMRERDWPARAEIGAANGEISADTVKVARLMADDEWDFLCGFCSVASVISLSEIAQFISQMNGLAQAREDPGTSVTQAPPEVLNNLNEVLCSSSGRKLKEVLADIEDELDEMDGQFLDDNRRVVDRLKDIYAQLENSAKPLLASVVDDFVELVQSYHIQVSHRLENIECGGNSITMTSVALTVADRNESMHHLLDELIWNSGCVSICCAVHQWQEYSRKQARLRSREMMATVPEDDEAEDDTAEGKHSSPRWLLPTDEVRMIERIAHGSFGAAYWGKWLDTDVVVKKVLTNQHETRNRLQFRHEVELWFSLNHANVIKLYGACQEQDKQPVFVCERAIHGTLPSFLKGKAREEVWGALYTAAQGLHHLHERGIVHGDLKGNNILVCDNDFVKLADFGLSEIAKPVLTPVDKPGSIGAIRWRAPECIKGFKPNFASDIYSFGMCIVEAVTGNFPWGRMPDPSVINHVVKEKLLPSRWDEFNRDEEKLVKRMCQYDPNDRIDIGAVVCLLYQLYSGTDPLTSSAEQDAGYTEAIVLQRFMALRSREKLPTGSEGQLPEWFIHAYQVDQAEHIGVSAFASVHKARWADADVAVKSTRADYEKMLEQFRRQVQIWSVLDHPNISPLYGACHVKPPFYVSGLAANGDLRRYLNNKSRQECWRCLLDAAVGLQYLHARGVIHGNLRCIAFLVCDRGVTKVGSFGLSAFAGSKDIYYGALGAIQWKAPEVLEGGKSTFAADVYSFGMCVMEALTGAYPWGSRDDAIVSYLVKRGELPPRPDGMHDGEWELVKRMCRFDPNSRISIDAVVCYIRGFIATE